MNFILNEIKGVSDYIIIGLVIFSIIIFIVLLVNLKRTKNLEKKYRRLIRGVTNKNLEELVISQLDKIDLADSKYSNIKDEINKLNNRLQGCLQKYSMIRYRAFENVGSDLSFSMAILDQNNSGVLLTGIYGRTESTTYAKPIDRGLSRYELSEEEAQVLKDAMTK
ncbi:MAG TPA: DUF4446 family protein [Clostridiaceae bacterium]